jgi:putative ABC transport system permease protein
VKVLDRKLRRDLRGALGRIIAIIVIIALGVACYVELRSCYWNLDSAKSAFYTQCRMADFSISLKKAPIAEIEALNQLPGVVEIRPRIQFFATVDLEGKPQLINGLVLSLPERDRPVINDIVLKRGDYFTETRDNEVIVNEAFARRHRLHPGQWIHLILNNRRQEMFVVGTAISSEFVYLVGPGSITPDPANFGVFYVKRRFAEEVFNFEGAANDVVGLLAPELRTRPDEFLRRAEAILEPYGALNTTPRKDQPSNRFLSEEIEGLATFSRILPTIFLVVAALVLNVLMTRVAEQQRTVVGTLKAVGYSDAEVFFHFLKFGLIIGSIGGVIGCGLGYALASWLMTIYKQFYEFPTLGNEFYPDLSIEGLAISLTCAALGTFYGARNVLKLTPAAAMRPRPPSTGRRVWLERIGWFWRELSFGWRTVLRGLIRNRFRTSAGIVAAALGAAILITGLMMQASMHFLIDFQFERIQRADFDLVFKEERSEAALFEAKALPGVDRAEPLLEVVCTFMNGPYQRRGAITGLAPGARLTVPRDSNGDPLHIAPVGLTMSRMLADILRLSPGDVVVVRPSRGERRNLRVPVSQITDTYIGLAVYADFHYLNKLVGESFAVSGVQLDVDGIQVNQRQLHKQLKELSALQAVSSREAKIKNLQDTVIDTQSTFLGVLIVNAGIIFFGSILNSSLISLAERQRDVATLFVLGYTPRQIGGLFFRETIVVNTIGTLLGLPLGYALATFVTQAYNNELFRIAVAAPPHVWLTTTGFAALFVVLAHLFVQRTINKLDWLDALKVKE